MFFLMCLDGCASALSFVLSACGTGGGGSQQGGRGLAERRGPRMCQRAVVEAVDWLAFY